MRPQKKKKGVACEKSHFHLSEVQVCISLSRWVNHCSITHVDRRWRHCTRHAGILYKITAAASHLPRVAPSYQAKAVHSKNYLTQCTIIVATDSAGRVGPPLSDKTDLSNPQHFNTGETLCSESLSTYGEIVQDLKLKLRSGVILGPHWNCSRHLNSFDILLEYFTSTSQYLRSEYHTLLLHIYWTTTVSNIDIYMYK